MSERPTESDVPADGFCPKCGALADQACCTPRGAARDDHAARHPYPIPPGTPTSDSSGSGAS